MATADTQGKKLHEFFNQLQESVAGGSTIDRDVVYAEAASFAPLQGWLSAHAEFTKEWFTTQTNEEILRLAKDLVAQKTEIEANLPELSQLRNQAETQTTPVTPARIKAIHDARETLVESLPEMKQRQTTQAREVAEKYTNAYVSGLREQLRRKNVSISDEALEETFKTLTDNPPDSTAHSQEEAINTMVEQISHASAFKSYQEEVETAAREVLQNNPSVVEDVGSIWNYTTTQAAAIEAITKDPTITDGKTFIETLAGAPQGFSMQNTIDNAAKASRMASALETPNLPDLTHVPIGSFVSGPAGTLVNVATTIVPGSKQAAMREVLTNAWEGAVHTEGFVDKVTNAVGKEAASHLGSVIESGNNLAAQQHQSRSIASAVGRFTSGVIESTKAPPSEAMTQYVAFVTKRVASGVLL